MKHVSFKVAIFAIAFGFVEAAVVVYLRHLLGSTQPEVGKEEILLLLPGIAFLEPQTALKIITDSALLKVERIREAFTLVILTAAASLAGKNAKEVVAYFFMVFGIWDIFYYIFLRLTVGWPKSLADLDVFFLLPTPWVGPVLVPILISTILIISSFFYLLKNKQSFSANKK